MLIRFSLQQPTTRQKLTTTAEILMNRSLILPIYKSVLWGTCMGTEYLDKLFETKSIAVIGASNREGSAGYRIFHNLISNDYQGKVYPVNLKHEKIQGIKAYKSVLDIPDTVEMAVVITPAKTVLGVAEECGKKGIHGMLIISAGFKEVG